MKTGENASGELFLENIGPHANISIGPGIRAWLRAINREKKPFVNDGGTVWFYGDNIESMARRRGSKILSRIRSLRTINGGKTEYPAGCIDALTSQHVMRDGPLFLTVDATLSANAAGENRRNERGKGHWPWYFRSIQDGTEERVPVEDVLVLQEDDLWPQRTVVPMYFTGPKNEATSPATGK